MRHQAGKQECVYQNYSPKNRREENAVLEYRLEDISFPTSLLGGR